MATFQWFNFGIPILLFFIIPGFLISQNPSDYAHLELGLVFLFMGLVTVLVGFSLVGISLIFHHFRLVRLARGASAFLFYYLLVSGLFLPVTSGTGMIVQPTSDPVDWMAFALCLFLAGGVTYLVLRRDIGKYILTFTGVVVALNAGTASLAFYQLYTAKDHDGDEKSAAKVALYQVSAERNLFTIGFDGLSRDVYVELLKAEAERYPELKDFTIFENVSTSSPATVASISAELYGNQNFKEYAQDDYEMRDSAPDRLMTNYLYDRGYRVFTYFDYDHGFKDTSHSFAIGDIAPQSLKERSFTILNLYRFVTVRVGTNYAVRALRKAGRIIGFDSFLSSVLNTFDPQDSSFSDDGWTFENQLWNAQLKYASVSDYEYYVTHLNVASGAPRAHFLHFYHTHYPITFDETCTIKGIDTPWFRDHQNPKGMKAEARCVLTQFSLFVAKLKELGVYDQSLIVFKSDHGRPAKYFDPNTLVSFKIRNHKDWGYGRYAPLLMIKGLQAQEDRLRFNDQPVMTDDLAHTLCAHSGSSEGCEAYPGYDLLSADLNISEQDSATYFIVKDQNSNYAFSSHVPLRLQRKKDFLHNLHGALVRERVPGNGKCPGDTTRSDVVAFNNGQTDNQTWASWFEEGGFHVQMNVKACRGDVKVVLADADKSANKPYPYDVLGFSKGQWERIAEGQTKSEGGLLTITLTRSQMDDATMVRIRVPAGDGHGLRSMSVETIAPLP